MKSYRILVLTDHRAHKPSNPVYNFIPRLREHPDCAYLDIASRGNPQNDPFFYGLTSPQVECLRLDSTFSFQEDGSQFVDTGYSQKLSDYDVILMRLARPVSSAFLSFLVASAPQAIFVNHPLGIQKTSSKAYLLTLAQFCPPLALCHSVEDILRFAERFPIVLKPLKEYGGKGLLRIEAGLLYEGDQTYEAREFLQRNAAYIQNDGYMAMQFLKNVRQGDKRILVVNGEILGASLRLPAPDSWLCNVAQGGSSVTATPAPEEIAMIQQIVPILHKEGVVIFGTDTLVDDDGKRLLSEINTLSVGGFLPIEQQTQQPVIQKAINNIFTYINHVSR